MNDEPASVRSSLFTRLFGALDAAGIAYVIVGRTDGFPERISSDVDFVVSSGDLERTLDILRQWRAGARLSQVLQHEVGAYYLVLTARSGNGFVHFHPDVSTSLTWLGDRLKLSPAVRLEVERLIAEMRGTNA